MGIHEVHINTLIAERNLVGFFDSTCFIEPVLWFVIWYDHHFSCHILAFKKSSWWIPWITLCSLLSSITWVNVLFNKFDLEHYSSRVGHIPTEQVICYLKFHKAWSIWCVVHTCCLVLLVICLEELDSIVKFIGSICSFKFLYHSWTLTDKIIKWWELRPYSVIIASTTTFRAWQFPLDRTCSIKSHKVLLTQEEICWSHSCFCLILFERRIFHRHSTRWF